MAIVPFLAMTAAEMRNTSCFPEKIAWMACHFSPYGLGLSNLPKELPPGALLMVDDITPPHGHDPVLIAEQLIYCAETLQCSGFLLDFQRQNCSETAALAKYLTEALPCPTAVSECYSRDLACPVFLPPVPPSVAPEEYFSTWQNRKIWLEIGLVGEELILTEQGCSVTTHTYPNLSADSFGDQRLLCHYSTQINENSARFTLWRTKEDFDQLLQEAEKQGISEVIGLYQEMHFLI